MAQQERVLDLTPLLHQYRKKSWLFNKPALFDGMKEKEKSQPVIASSPKLWYTGIIWKGGISMAKQRDYKREYQTSVARGERDRFKTIGTSVPIETYEAFRRKAEDKYTSMSAIIREWIEVYVNEEDD